MYQVLPSVYSLYLLVLKEPGETGIIMLISKIRKDSTFR